MSREKMFTPGPWEVEFNESGEHKIMSCNIDDGSAEVCRTNDTWIRDSRQLANANLISAAPELLEALEMIMDKDPASFMTFHEAMAKAERAIKKAHGETG